MLRIYITRQSRYPADTKALKARVRRVLKERGASSAQVNISISGERKMRSLAQKYLGETLQDPVHEVLSFPTVDPTRGSGQVKISDREYSPWQKDVLPLGDIIICYPEVRKIAMKRNRLVDDVLGELAEHGTLHLLGIHHGE